MGRFPEDEFRRLMVASANEMLFLRTALNGSVATRAVAAGTIPSNRLVKGHTDGTYLVGTLGSKRIIGANAESVDVASGTEFFLALHAVQAVAAEPILAGDLIKCGDNGRILQFQDADSLSETIGTGTAGNFGNQPANDAVEVLSASVLDVTQTVTIIGTTQATHTVVTETVTLTGTTFKATTKTDWGLVLAVKLSGATAGDITIREASGNLTITTITAGDLSAGVVVVGDAARGCHGLIPLIVAGGASTKEVGVLYEPATGAADAYMANALNGTTPVALPTAANLVKEIYLGDVATGTAASVTTAATEEDEQICCGKALESITTGATGSVSLRS